jgi:hypothetical protein
MLLTRVSRSDGAPHTAFMYALSDGEIDPFLRGEFDFFFPRALSRPSAWIYCAFRLKESSKNLHLHLVKNILVT